MTLRSTLLAALVAAVPVIAPASALDVQKVVSPGGVEAWLVEDATNPIVAVNVMFRGGAALDPEDRPGAARFLAAMLDEGAGDLDSRAFQTRLEDLSIELSFGANRESLTASARTLSETLEETFRLMGLALSQPRFDDAPLERIRGQLTARLRADEADQEQMAARLLREVAFPDHPYGRAVDGAVESAAAMTADDLRAAHARGIARDRLIVSVAGDVSAEMLAPMLDLAFAGTPARAAVDWRVAEASPEGLGRILAVDYDAPQTRAFFMQPGPARDDPDWFALALVNHVLGGGGFASRLVDEVREARGLAYSVYSALAPRQAAPIWFGGFATANERFEEAWNVVRAEWRRMAEDGPTDSELADAKAYLIGSFALRFTSTRSIAGVLTAMQRDGLALDYAERRAALINAVTIEDARRVAARWLDPDRLLLSVAGRPDGPPEARIPASDG